MTEQLNQGDLVVTKEGYFALVIFQEEEEVGVFLCNGLAAIEERDDLTVQTILDGPARANFMECFTLHLTGGVLSTRTPRDHSQRLNVTGD